MTITITLYSVVYYLALGFYLLSLFGVCVMARSMRGNAQAGPVLAKGIKMLVMANNLDRAVKLTNDVEPGVPLAQPFKTLLMKANEPEALDDALDLANAKLEEAYHDYWPRLRLPLEMAHYAALALLIWAYNPSGFVLFLLTVGFALMLYFGVCCVHIGQTVPESKRLLVELRNQLRARAKAGADLEPQSMFGRP